MGSATSGSPWLVVTLAVISALGTGLTAVLAPAVVEWVKGRKPTGTQPALAVPAQQAADAINLIRNALGDLTHVRDALGDLQVRVVQLEELQMQPRAGSHR